MNEAMIHCRGLGKSYHDGNASIDVLTGLDFSLHPGERLAIVGPSGSGKSTLLHLLSGLDQPTQGQVFIQGMDWQTQSE